jgi:hypothetical protein
MSELEQNPDFLVKPVQEEFISQMLWMKYQTNRL